MEFYPKDDETKVWIAPAHIGNEFEFLLGMLIGVMKRATGTILQRFGIAVKAFTPTINGGARDVETPYSGRNAVVKRICYN